MKPAFEPPVPEGGCMRGIWESPKLTEEQEPLFNWGSWGAGVDGLPLQDPQPPSASAPQGWTSRPTRTRRVTRRPTNWRSTRTPRNAPSGPTLGSTGPSPPMGASSPPRPQSESPVLGVRDPSASRRGIQRGFSSLGAHPKTLPGKSSEFPGELGLDWGFATQEVPQAT